MAATNTDSFWGGLQGLAGTYFGAKADIQTAKAEQEYYAAQRADEAALQNGNMPPEVRSANTRSTILLIGGVTIAALAFVLIAKRLT